MRVKYEVEAPAGKAKDEVVEEEQEEAEVPTEPGTPGFRNRGFGTNPLGPLPPRLCPGLGAQFPWVSFLHFMSKDEVRENFGPEAAARIPFSEGSDAGEGEGESEGEKVPGLCPVTVYEIWDKHTKTVYFVTEGYLGIPEGSRRPPEPGGILSPCPGP